MAEYFGFRIDESYPGELEGLLDGVDPKYHRAIALGLSYLCGWYGDKAYRQLDEWFTVIYGTVMAVEEVHDEELKRYRGVQINFEDIIPKDI